MINKAKIDFLEHRSSLNAKVLGITERIAAINAMMIEVNRDIMAANEEIVGFNAGNKNALAEL
jgi:hypothetical protein